MNMNQKGFVNIVLVVVIVVLLGAVGYFAFVKKSEPITQQPTPTPAATPTLTPKDETANWKTYRNAKYGIELKYPSLLNSVQTSNPNYDLFTYCNGKIVKLYGTDVGERCDGTQYKIGVTVHDEKLDPNKLTKYYDAYPADKYGNSIIKKYVVNGRDFYIGKSIVYTYEGWYVHTAIGDKTMALDFSGNAYVLHPNSNVLSDEELEQMKPILSSLKVSQ